MDNIQNDNLKVKILNDKNYTFKKLTMKQIAKFVSYCKELARKEIEVDIKAAGLEGMDYYNALNGIASKVLAEEKQGTMEGGMYLIELSLEDNHNKEEIEKFINEVDLGDIGDLTSFLTPQEKEEVTDGKKKGQMQSRKKKVSRLT